MCTVVRNRTWHLASDPQHGAGAPSSSTSTPAALARPVMADVLVPSGHANVMLVALSGSLRVRGCERFELSV